VNRQLSSTDPQKRIGSENPDRMITMLHRVVPTAFSKLGQEEMVLESIYRTNDTLRVSNIRSGGQVKL